MGCSRARFEQWVEGKGVLVKTQGVFARSFVQLVKRRFFTFSFKMAST